MGFNTKGYLAICLALTFAMKAEAVSLKFGPKNFYLWSNQQGLSPVSSEQCELVESKNMKLFVSHYFGEEESQLENLRDEKLQKKYLLLNGSLVKTTEKTIKRVYQEVEVLGENYNQVNRDYIEKNKVAEKMAQRLDKGYIFKNSLMSLKPFAFKLHDQRVDADGLLESEIHGKYLKGIYFGEEDEERIAVLRCQMGDTKRDYQLFALYDSEQSTEEDSYVGIYHDETSLLKQYQSEDEILDGIEFDFSSLVKHLKKIPLSPKLNSEISESSDTDDKEIVSEQTVQGEFQYVICSASPINARTEDLSKVAFSATPGELIKVFQGFEDIKKSKTIDRKTYTFLKVEFPEREAKDQKVAWVADTFIKLISECQEIKKGTALEEGAAAGISGLKDKDCCNFPTTERPTESYLEGKRMFGWSRGKRLHAACDLYRNKDDPAVSVAPGQITLGHYYFYQGTFAIEVKHAGGFVARYGELTSKKAEGVKTGEMVSAGQRLGYIGKVNSGCCEPMLHFELYSGSMSGRLKGGGKYKRRADLLNPTKFLQSWEQKKFGTSY
jgi:hypothetical protein